MRDAVSALLGVPATILLTGGLGIIGVTLASRVRPRRREPIRWAHLVLGIGLAGMGVLIVQLDWAFVIAR